MFAYVTLAWDPSDAESAARASEIARLLEESRPGWTAILAERGVRVLHTGATQGCCEPHLLGNHGVVLGTVFDRDAAAASVAPLRDFSASQSALILRSGCRELVRGFWGRYVTFAHDTQSGTLRVLRDPVGSIACFHAVTGRVHLFFSRASDIAALHLLEPTINWPFVAAHVIGPRVLRCRETAFREVEEILPGECWTLDARREISRRLYWSPTTFAQLDRKSSIGLLPRLRNTLETCVAAWASCYPRITHLLSGGIDSSIVLHCLRQTRPAVEVTALNYFNRFSSYADERRFARMAAESARCALAEVEEDPSDADLRVLLDAAASPKPLETQYFQTHTRLEREVTDRNSSNAVFSGSGGDQLFFLSPLSLAAADYVTEQGVDRYFFTLCNEIARHEDTLYWPILASSLRDGWRLRKWHSGLHIRKMLLATPEARRAAFRSGLLDPPWLELAADLPSGKIEHLRACYVLNNDLHNPLSPLSSPERVHALGSQPLIELCASVPLYVMAWYGQDRILAREAFRDRLPGEIVERRAKGSADAFMQRLFARNVAFAREVLLSGALVENGYLDRKKLEAVLLHPEGSLLPEAAEIVMYHLNTECFLQNVPRHWLTTHR